MIKETDKSVGGEKVFSKTETKEVIMWCGTTEDIQRRIADKEAELAELKTDLIEIQTFCHK